jgi:sec-independent protein translocase protein TatB
MNLGLPEMIFIFLLALIIFGPRKLPEIGRQIGKAMGEFRRASNEFKSQIDSEIRNLELEEALKRQPAPQILPPEGSVANNPDDTAAVPAAETPAELAAETPAAPVPDAVAAPVPESSEQAKAADV